MTPLRYSRALARIAANVDGGASHGSCGVWIFKLKKTYWANAAGVLHDGLYKDIDWKVGSAEADLAFLRELLKLAGDNQDRRDEARVLYSIARNWGKGRWGLAAVGACW